MPEPFGRCERVNNCTYDHDPNKILGLGERSDYVPRPLPPPKEARSDYRVPEYAFNSTFRDHSGNHLMQWLRGVAPEGADKALMDYRVGTYTGRRKELHGAAMFWLIDKDGGIRTGHAIPYAENGHRRKDSKDNCWAHHALTGKDATSAGVGECFFGEHLLCADPEATVCIVESEKTAIIASIFYPGCVWLATGGENKLSRLKMRTLRGRNVILFPDIGPAYSNWMNLADDLGAYFLTSGSLRTSDILECIEQPGDKGKDLADFLLPVNMIYEMDIDILSMPDEPEDNEELEDTEEEAPEPTQQHPPVIQRMIAKNPHIAGLIDALDLDTSKLTLHA